MSSIETYADFSVALLHDGNGGKLWEEDLFLNCMTFGASAVTDFY